MVEALMATKLVVVALVAERLVNIAVTALSKVAKRLVLVALLAVKLVTLSLVVVALVIMVFEAFKLEALVTPVKERLFKLLILVVETTPFTVLVKVLVEVAKLEVLLDMTEEVAITPFTVVVKVLPLSV